MPSRNEWMLGIEARSPVRILCIVYPPSPLFSQSDITSIKQEAVQNLGADGDDANIILLQTWRSRTILVFDLCHDNYNFQTAHHAESIDVLAVHFLAAMKIRIGIVTGAPRDRVHEEVADAHRSYGFAPLPFIDEHRNGHVPTHWNPRKD